MTGPIGHPASGNNGTGGGGAMANGLGLVTARPLVQRSPTLRFPLSMADTVTVDDLPPAMRGTTSLAPDADLSDDTELPTLEDAERRLVAAALQRSGGNKNEAARLLGIDRQRLYRKIDKYRLG